MRPCCLTGRSFLKELDFTVAEWQSLLTLAADLKAEKKAGRERQRLAGRNIALIFEKASTRTRCAFEVAAHDQGAHVTYLDPSGSHFGHKESVGTPRACWDACTTGSSTAASPRRPSRRWPSTPAYRCGTDSPTSGTRPSRSATC